MYVVLRERKKKLFSVNKSKNKISLHVHKKLKIVISALKY